MDIHVLRGYRDAWRESGDPIFEEGHIAPISRRYSTYERELQSTFVSSAVCTVGSYIVSRKTIIKCTKCTRRTRIGRSWISRYTHIPDIEIDPLKYIGLTTREERSSAWCKCPEDISWVCCSRTDTSSSISSHYWYTEFEVHIRPDNILGYHYLNWFTDTDDIIVLIIGTISFAYERYRRSSSSYSYRGATFSYIAITIIRDIPGGVFIDSCAIESWFYDTESFIVCDIRVFYTLTSLAESSELLEKDGTHHREERHDDQRDDEGRSFVSGSIHRRKIA